MLRSNLAIVGTLLLVVNCSGNVDHDAAPRAQGGADTASAGAATQAGGSGASGAGRGGAGASHAGASDAGEPSAAGTGSAGAPPDGEPCDIAPLTTNALSAWEYERSVYALSGTVTAVTLPNDPPIASRFGFAMSMDAATVEKLFTEAEAQGAAARSANFLPCQAGGADDACVAELVDELVGRAFRRELSENERARYVSLFEAAADDASGVELVVTAALFSPLFLHKIYLGEGSAAPGSGSALSPFELASRLSLLLTGAPPDAALREAAHQEQLSTSQLEAQARRLMATPSFVDSVDHFHVQWLGLDELPSVAPQELDAPLLASMRGETVRFIRDIFEGERRLPDFFLSHSSFLDELLAPRYGVPAPAQSGFIKYALDETRTFGLLTKASTLVQFGTPTLRGNFVLDRFLCSTVPSHPEGVNTTFDVAPDQTRREALMATLDGPTCAACHNLTDSIGFGLENFDEFGLFRVVDNGKPVDASGALAQSGDATDGPFAGVAELAEKLAQSERVSECVTRQWLEYALQRSLTASDACEVDQIHEAFVGAELDMGDLLAAIVKSNAFRYRDDYTPPDVPVPGAIAGSAQTPLERRKLLLDLALAESQWLQAKLPPGIDRMVIDQYMTSVRELEQKLSQL